MSELTLPKLDKFTISHRLEIIDKLKKISIEKKWNLVRWITRDNNVRAKKVYDKVSNLTNWDVYELS